MIDWTARGLLAVGRGDDAISFTTNITGGHKSALGKRITVSLSRYNLTFLMTVIAARYPEAIRKLAAALGDYEPPERGYHPDYSLDSRLRSAFIEGIGKYGKTGGGRSD